ncbi:DUF4391 domain-containing protein [Methylomonas sp. LL1]|uniref:DUF4391 domain-containing protein n=1 Tax=Methylomonas sp. LL1 TaxID=2785785 RepID=UPI0018C3D697|nr:DUF4391 domain-containing protein [Methylomonas sp. LL1]QPK62909.1 DUF4391 domain-containing protein [Methylomonas sp. LL1]
MSAVLFHYPKQALFGRVLPKNKIYQHASPSPAVKELFVQQVEQIIWQYKLAPETINLSAKPGIPEIQIFDISLKSPNLDEAVLRCIDKAIPYPIFFQLLYNDRIKIVAAYKRINEADSEKWVVDGYFASDWYPQVKERQALPVALDLGLLYEQLLRQLLPSPPRAGEPLKDQIERLSQLQSKQNEYQKLEAKLHKEKQFNRKVELNAQLRTLKAALHALKY